MRIGTVFGACARRRWLVRAASTQAAPQSRSLRRSITALLAKVEANGRRIGRELPEELFPPEALRERRHRTFGTDRRHWSAAKPAAHTYGTKLIFPRVRLVKEVDGVKLLREL